MKRIWIDTETSGLHPRDGARILEVAAIDDTGQQWFESLSNPGADAMNVSGVDKALSINRITRDQVSKAEPELKVAGRLSDWLFKVLGDGPGQVHSFNVWFDSQFLQFNPWNLGLKFWGECVMHRAQQEMIVARAPQLIRFPSGDYKWPKLSEAAEFFRVPVEGTPHRALTDARTARAIHLKILASCGARSTT